MMTTASTLIDKHFGQPFRQTLAEFVVQQSQANMNRVTNCASVSSLWTFDRHLCDFRKNADVSAPPGFERISINLNHGRTGKGAPYIFVCVRRGDRTELPITEVTLFVRKHDEIPLDVTAASMESGKYNDTWEIVSGSLNEGGASTSEEIFLGFKREKDGSPIVNLAFVYGDEKPKEDGFKMVNVDLNGEMVRMHLYVPAKYANC